jgi:hypothetical protein
MKKCTCMYCSLEIAKLIMKKLCRKVECRVSSEHHPASSLQMCALLGTFFDVVVGGREACCGANLSLLWCLSAGNNRLQSAKGTQNKHVIKATVVNSRKLTSIDNTTAGNDSESIYYIYIYCSSDSDSDRVLTAQQYTYTYTCTEGYTSVNCKQPSLHVFHIQQPCT